MPQLVAVAASYVGSLAGSAALAAGASSAVAMGAYYVGGALVYAAVIAGPIAYSQSQAAKARRALMASSPDQGRDVMVRDAVAPRRLIYGQALVSGPIVFMHTTGAKNEYLHLVVVLAGHEVEEIGDIYFNDELVAIPAPGGEPASGPYAGGYARVNKHRGVSGDTADADLIAETGGLWTTDHKLAGCAYLAVRLKWDTDKFAQGIPTIKAMVKGKKVYDPRTDSVAYSANAALCTADFLMDQTFGKGVAYARVREADLIEAANICDEDIVLDDTTTEKRYEINGLILSSQDPAISLGDLAGAMAGCVVDSGGLWTIRAGAYRSSTLTITDGDLIGSFSVQPRQSRKDTFNRVRGIYISPQTQWAEADFPAVKNTTYKADDGGVWLDRDVQYNFTTSPAAAQRLAKIELERGRQQVTVTTLCNLKAMRLIPGDTVAITRARLGWTAKEFEVVEWSFKAVGESDAPALGIELSLRETAAGVWDWADGEETPVDLAPNTDLPDPFKVPTPSGLTLLTDATTVIVQPDGTVQPRLKVSWSTPNDIHVESGGGVEIEYKRTADSDWTVWGEVRGDALFDFITDVKVGLQYDVRIRFRNNASVRGTYAFATSSAIVGDAGVPSSPASLTATAKPGYIDLNWTPSTSNTVNEYKIFRSVVSAVAGFALLANTANSQYQDAAVTAGSQYWYYVVAISASEVDSVATSVQTATALIPPAGSVPSNPTAPAQPGSPVVGSYPSSDGTAFAFVTLEIAALPAGAVWQNLLYRKTGSSEWLIGGQYKNTGTVTVRLDDLSPGIGYDIATQAFNGAGGSSVVAGSSFTAASSGAPSAPTSVTYTPGDASDYNEKPVFGSLGLRFSAKVEWAVPSDKSVYRWQWVLTTTDSDAAADAAANPVGPGLQSNYVDTPRIVVSKDLLGLGAYFRVRAINATGFASAWAGGGTNLDSSTLKKPLTLGDAAAKDTGTGSGQVAAGNDSRITGAAQKSNNLSDLGSASAARGNLGLGSVAVQNSTDVAVTGITTGNGFSQRKVVSRQPIYATINLSGGTTQETVNFSLFGVGFSTRPDAGWIQSADYDRMLIRYDIDDSSSSTAVLRVTMADGSNVPSVSGMEITGEFVEYD